MELATVLAPYAGGVTAPRHAWVTALAVLPFSALGAWGTDRACYQLEAEVAGGRPEPGTARAAWCAVVEPHRLWVLPVLLPSLAAAALLLVFGRWRGTALYGLAVVVGGGFAIWQVLHVSGLAAVHGI